MITLRMSTPKPTSSSQSSSSASHRTRIQPPAPPRSPFYMVLIFKCIILLISILGFAVEHSIPLFFSVCSIYLLVTLFLTVLAHRHPEGSAR